MFFKLEGAEYPIFSVELPESVCLGMLQCVLKVYFQSKGHVQQGMLLVSPDVVGQTSTGCIMIYMSHSIEANVKQTFAESTLLKLARFCTSYQIDKAHFFYVKNLGEQTEYYKPRWCLRDLIKVYIRKLQLEEDVSDILKSTLSAGLSADLSIQIVERMFERLEEDAQKPTLDRVHNPLNI